MLHCLPWYSVRLGVKPYACTMCDRRFFQRYHLQRHSLTHTGMSTCSQNVSRWPLHTTSKFVTPPNISGHHSLNES